jgi:hypothetical protein
MKELFQLQGRHLGEDSSDDETGSLSRVGLSFGLNKARPSFCFAELRITSMDGSHTCIQKVLFTSIIHPQ